MSSHRTNGPWVVLAVLLFLASVSPPGVAAEQDPKEGSAAGELDFQLSRYEGVDFQVENGEHGPRIDGNFDLDQAILNLSYVAFPNATEGPRQVNASLTLSGIYEFRDLNANQRFDLGDEVVRFTSLVSSRSARIETKQAPEASQGFEASYRLDGGGRLSYTFYVTPRLAFLSASRPLQPTEVEANVTLENFPTSADDTRLGLATRLESRHLDHSGPDEIHVQGDRADLVYWWRSTAEVDEAGASTRSTVVHQPVDRDGNDREQATLVRAVTPGETVSMQESFELHLTQASQDRGLASLSGDPLLYIGGLVVAGLLVGGNALLKLRTGGRPPERGIGPDED